MIETLATLSQVVPPAEFDLTRIVETGILGIVLVLAMWKKLAPGWVVNENEKSLTELESENNRLHQVMIDDVIPALVRATEAIERMTRRLDDDDSKR